MSKVKKLTLEDLKTIDGGSDARPRRWRWETFKRGYARCDAYGLAGPQSEGDGGTKPVSEPAECTKPKPGKP